MIRNPQSAIRNRVLIYGCGGHGRVILDILRAQAGEHLPVVFVDDNPLLEGRHVDGAPVYPRARLGELLREG